MSELTGLDIDALRLIAKFQGATDRDMHEALSHYDARLLLEGVRDFNQPWVGVGDNVRSLCDQLEKAIPPVPDEGWRSHVTMIAFEAERLLLVAGVRA